MTGRQNPAVPSDGDPWMPEDPDELPDPRVLLAYWQTENRSAATQQQLVSDQWRLWRLARDMADALDRACGETSQHG